MAVYITTFKIFKHNFWTNEWSRFLYEGRYYKFGSKDISKVSLRQIGKGKRFGQYVVFTIPKVWLKEYQKGVFLEWAEFPKNLRKKLEACASTKTLSKALEKELKNYFVKKISITEKQAKVLLKLQLKENVSVKEMHTIHKKIGL